MAGLKGNYLITEDKERILFYVDYNSKTLYEILRKNLDHDYTLVRKYLTHSDLVTRGKLSYDKKKKLDKKEYVKCCMLYYQSAEELAAYDKLPVAAQSNIALPDEFYKATDIVKYEENDNKSYDIVERYTYDIFIPRDTLDNFNPEDFNRICEINGKNQYSVSLLKKLRNFRYDEDVNANGLLKLNTLHIAAHGMGTHKDAVFDHLRSFVFKGDVLNLLYDGTDKVLYLFFERNEKYYELLNAGKADNEASYPIWKGYDSRTKENIVKTLFCLSDLTDAERESKTYGGDTDLSSEDVSELLAEYYSEYKLTVDKIAQSGKTPTYRWFQNKWRETLIKIDEIQYNVKGYAVCAISGTRGEYSKLGKFFIASHIKPYADCIKEKDYESAFDPYNGIILCANIDALFDKFLISIDERGKIVASSAAKKITGYGKFKFDGNILGGHYLTEKRKKYLELHKKEFDRRNGET